MWLTGIFAKWCVQVTLVWRIDAGSFWNIFLMAISSLALIDMTCSVIFTRIRVTNKAFTSISKISFQAQTTEIPWWVKIAYTSVFARISCTWGYLTIRTGNSGWTSAIISSWITIDHETISSVSARTTETWRLMTIFTSISVSL